MGEIRIIMEGTGRRSVKGFAKISEAVEHMVKNGYTVASGQPFYHIEFCTRLYKNTHSGRYARIDTTSDCGCWLTIVRESASNIPAL